MIKYYITSKHRVLEVLIEIKITFLWGVKKGFLEVTDELKWARFCHLLSSPLFLLLTIAPLASSNLKDAMPLVNVKEATSKPHIM